MGERRKAGTRKWSISIAPKYISVDGNPSKPYLLHLGDKIRYTAVIRPTTAAQLLFFLQHNGLLDKDTSQLKRVEQTRRTFLGRNEEY
jgi:hypothetical protein